MKKKLKPIPKFKNEDQERAFWAAADASDYFDFAKAEPAIFPNLKPARQRISLRMPAWLINGLKSLANQRDIPYQSLTKIFLAERVKEELAV